MEVYTRKLDAKLPPIRIESEDRKWIEKKAKKIGVGIAEYVRAIIKFARENEK